MLKSRLYTPPAGYFDMPFTWAFDASIFANGSSPLGSSIYLLGGYGNFFMRRVVGLNRILAADGTGKFQIARKSRNVYLSSDPVQAPNTPELAIAPAEPYLETGRIWFDLYGIQKPGSQPLSSQLAFQGVRRQKGTGDGPAYKFFPKTFTYQVTGTLLNVAPAGPYVTRTPIVDYDFELYQLIIMKSQPAGTFASLTVVDENTANPTYTANAIGAGGNSITIQVVSNNGVPNGVFGLTAIGDAITITLASTALGVPTSTGFDVLAAILANPVANGLITLTFSPGAEGNVFSFVDYGPTNLTGGSGAGGGTLSPLTTPVCSLQVFDQNKVAISNLPVLDIFYNGGPGSPYENGAVVPPLFYKKDSVLEIDFYSQITDPGQLPTSVTVYLVGRQLIPC